MWQLVAVLANWRKVTQGDTWYKATYITRFVYMHGSLMAFNKTLARKVPPTLYLMEVSRLEKVTYLVDLGNTMPCENAMQVFSRRNLASCMWNTAWYHTCKSKVFIEQCCRQNLRAKAKASRITNHFVHTYASASNGILNLPLHVTHQTNLRVRSLLYNYFPTFFNAYLMLIATYIIIRKFTWQSKIITSNPSMMVFGLW